MVAFYNQGDQNIYNSGQHFVPQEQYRLGYTAPTPSVEEQKITQTFGIPNTNAFTNSGGGNYSGPTGNLINNFNAINQDKYFSNQATPNVDGLDQSMRDKTFMGMRSYNENQDVNPADAGEYLAAGQDIPTNFSPTFAGRVQNTLGKGKDLVGKGLGMAANAALGIPGLSYALGKMDRFDTLPAMDRDFINQNKYYTGPTIFGENDSGLGKDPFGINTRSAFGNYAQHSRDMAAEDGDLAETVADQIARGLTNTLQMKQLHFHKEKQKQAAIDLEIAQSDAAAANDKATNKGFQKAMAQGDAFYDGLNRGRGASVSKESRENAGAGFNDNTPGNPFAKGGRVGYFFGGRVNFKNGGLASIL